MTDSPWYYVIFSISSHVMNYALSTVDASLPHLVAVMPQDNPPSTRESEDVLLVDYVDESLVYSSKSLSAYYSELMIHC